MRYKILALFIGMIITAGLHAQGGTPKGLRIVDTLTVHERATRNPVILRSEVDSLIRQWLESHPQQPVQVPVKESKSELNIYMLIGIAAVLLLLGIMIVFFYRHQQRINRTIAGLGSSNAQAEKQSVQETNVSGRSLKGKASLPSLEKKISDMDAELQKLSKENEGLNGVIREYNGIQHEYDSLKHVLAKAYKVKNYPGYDKTKAETSIIQGVLATESAVANYAYEKFLKPILVITDANKNNPAKLSAENTAKLMDLLVSLSLLYIEYLYLRVSDLAIGGKMVERIQGFSNGNGLDPLLLKKLDMEFGSRALVLRMALDKAQLHALSYPVFDETNLNPQ